MYEGEQAFLKTLLQTQWASAAEISTYQDRLLERLCRHAVLQSEAYRPRLRRLFVSGDGARGRFQRENWAKTPILSRDEARSLGEKLWARNVPPEAGIVTDVFTSGTTGRPLALRKNSLVTLGNLALFARLLENWGLPAGHVLCSIVDDHEGSAAPPEGRTDRGWNISNQHGAHHSLSFAANTSEMVDWLLLRRPSYLRAYPNAVRAILDELGRRRAALELKAVFTTGETFEPELSQRIHEVLGAVHLDTYGLREIGDIASNCPVSGLKHVNAETVLAEVLRDDGSPCAPGETGRIVVTPFYNYASPLIRYETGDLAVQGPERCPCGRSLPSIERVIGRVRSQFCYPDGTKRTSNGINQLANHISYRQWQLVHVGGWRIEFRYVPDAPFDASASTTAIALLRRLTHERAEISLVPVDSIPRGEGGKIEDCVSLT